MTELRRDPVRLVLAGIASLKLTVVLLGLSIFLVFAGTLAQVESGLWRVLEQYFRCWFAWIDFKVFYPAGTDVGGGFPFPGGKLLGAAMVVNLLVSHTSRIRLAARGPRLILGCAVTAVGMAATFLAIAHVFDADSSQKKVEPFWRVTFQLIQGGGVALVLFWGCRMLFARKAGIVLLHAGVVLLMVSELVTAGVAREGRMTIAEGQKVNFVEDSRLTELAFVRPGGDGSDEVVVVPEALLHREGLVQAPELPYDVRVAKGAWMVNADLRPPKPGESNPATAGRGTGLVAVERPEASGTGSEIDLPAVYVTLEDKATHRALGTYVASLALTFAEPGGQPVGAGERPWAMSLRFERTYKPYEVYLRDFRFERYPGTQTPKDYSAFVRLSDAERGVERDVRIWMNNPLRYRGDTLYQSSFDAATEQETTLQVVSNAGWMVPYVACMIVAVGLIGQFGLHFIGFLRRERIL